MLKTENLTPVATKLANLLIRERPKIAVQSGPPIAEPTKQQELLAEYKAVAKSVGFNHPHFDGDLIIERFKDFLRAKDWSVFPLPAVIDYMNKKSAEESAAKAGWHWRPLREKDNIRDARFGFPAHQRQDGQIQPACDHYFGPHKERRMRWSNSGQNHTEADEEITASALPYDKLVPLHALRKVATILREFPEPVSFFISDYAPAPYIEHPDPFLMAVINNLRMHSGCGRFVIDFWDEPGFGLEAQLGLAE